MVWRREVCWSSAVQAEQHVQEIGGSWWCNYSHNKFNLPTILEDGQRFCMFTLYNKGVNLLNTSAIDNGKATFVLMVFISHEMNMAWIMVQSEGVQGFVRVVMVHLKRQTFFELLRRFEYHLANHHNCRYVGEWVIKFPGRYWEPR